MDWPAVEHVPVDDDEEVVELDEELVIAAGAELGAAAAAEGAAPSGEAGTDAAAEGAAEAAADGATDGATDPAAPEAAIEGAAAAAPEDPEDADPDEPEPAALDPDEEDPAAAPVEFDADADPDEAPPPAGTLHLGPVGAVRVPLPSFSTEAPGSGNCTSAESTVSQSLVGMFALNMPGKDAARSESSATPRVSLRERALFLDPPLTLIEAQFMYISRLPILLNQVQAKVYAPGLMPSGMEYV